MSELRLYLFDDRRARRWAPFTLTRPAGELLFGCLRQRERIERAFGVPCTGHVSRRALLGFDEPGAAPVIAHGDVAPTGRRVLLSSRVVPDLPSVDLPAGSARFFVDGSLVGWLLDRDDPVPPEEWLRDPGTAQGDAPRVDLDGTLLGHPWDLIEQNPGRIARDVADLWPGDDDPEGVVRVGRHSVSLGEGAAVEPGVYLDVREGPIRLGDGVRVEGPARLTGPLFVDSGSTILGGPVGTSSIGPTCLVRGEVVHSVFLGFVNKAHDGHIGHALVGHWVNLGAFTTNSDLKNNYRTVRVWTPDGDRDSGLLKVGCFLGDHVKTGIGTVLNTGSVIGAGSNLYGGIMPPTVVPPFSWGAGGDLRDHRLEKFLDTAVRVMERRSRALTPGVEEILKLAWRETAGRRAE